MGLRSQESCLTIADDPRGLLVACIELHGGRLNWVAHDLGLGRRRLYDKIYSLHLWPVVNRARARRRQERIREAACPTT